MRILVVDDNRDILNLVEQIVQSEGHEVVTARDGLEALQQAATLLPDAVVLDINMPGLEGWEVCRRIKSQRSIPVMMLSVRAEKEEVARGLALGADEYLAKPFEIGHFLDRLRAMLDRAYKKDA